MANKTKVTTWITHDALRSLRDLAAVHQLTVSQVAADILERGLKERVETAGLGLLGPSIQGVVKREVGRMSDRLANLIARTALEAATARRLVFQLLVRQLTTDEARARPNCPPLPLLRGPAVAQRRVPAEAGHHL